MREELGLDRSLFVQYFDWLWGVVTGDLGTSYGMGYDIFDEIVRRIEPTLYAANRLAQSVRTVFAPRTRDEERIAALDGLKARLLLALLLAVGAAQQEIRAEVEAAAE